MAVPCLSSSKGLCTPRSRPEPALSLLSVASVVSKETPVRTSGAVVKSTVTGTPGGPLGLDRKILSWGRVVGRVGEGDVGAWGSCSGKGRNVNRCYWKTPRPPKSECQPPEPSFSPSHGTPLPRKEERQSSPVCPFGVTRDCRYTVPEWLVAPELERQIHKVPTLLLVPPADKPVPTRQHGDRLRQQLRGGVTEESGPPRRFEDDSGGHQKNLSSAAGVRDSVRDRPVSVGKIRTQQSLPTPFYSVYFPGVRTGTSRVTQRYSGTD